MQEMQDMQVRFLSETSPGVGNGNPLQYSCWENSIGACWAEVDGVTKSKR